jgi:hypothetical protein
MIMLEFGIGEKTYKLAFPLFLCRRGGAENGRAAIALLQKMPDQRHGRAGGIFPFAARIH